MLSMPLIWLIQYAPRLGPVYHEIHRNGNGMVKNSPVMVKSAADAAMRAGVHYKVQSASFGGPGCDGTPFSRAGLRVATMLP